MNKDMESELRESNRLTDRYKNWLDMLMQEITYPDYFDEERILFIEEMNKNFYESFIHLLENGITDDNIKYSNSGRLMIKHGPSFYFVDEIDSKLMPVSPHYRIMEIRGCDRNGCYYSVYPSKIIGIEVIIHEKYASFEWYFAHSVVNLVNGVVDELDYIYRRYIDIKILYGNLYNDILTKYVKQRLTLVKSIINRTNLPIKEDVGKIVDDIILLDDVSEIKKLVNELEEKIHYLVPYSIVIFRRDR